MSLTYIAAIVQFLVVLGLITQEEAQTLSDGVVAVVSLITLFVTLWGRFRAGGVDIFGIRTPVDGDITE